ncbi:MAG TPA: VOC family protein [Phenylobacterium sp.]|nr:VOC family protein [Phenylobacterium sp.]
MDARPALPQAWPAMLPLDHLPFPTSDLEGLAEAMRRLGFTVSPRGRYVQPDGAVFPNRCVFLKKGWFDLLQADEAPAEVLPRGCLFLTGDVQATRVALADLGPSRRTFLLERRWDQDVGRPPERFRWIGFKTDRLGVQAAAVEHAWPCVDILPEWQVHPNGAVEILGLASTGKPPGETGLDTSGFLYLSAEAVAETYGAELAVRLKVDDLWQTRRALHRGGVEWRQAGASLIIPPHGAVACAFEFSA